MHNVCNDVSAKGLAKGVRANGIRDAGSEVRNALKAEAKDARVGEVAGGYTNPIQYSPNRPNDFYLTYYYYN